ncbi:MAG: inorganic polyphosphate/ATP-NAD kinase [Actinomycetospora sp.]|nr:inorganic polyphosphate/ATP-NAD kinase [Actinomycetospora sp.]
MSDDRGSVTGLGADARGNGAAGPPPGEHSVDSVETHPAADRPVGDGTTRDALLVVHTGRAAPRRVAAQAARRLAEAGFALRVLPDEYSTDEGLFDELPPELCPQTVDAGSDAALGMEIVMVLGGDGTLLRAAELARHARVPMLGINLGRVGFLAEADIDDLDEVLDAVVNKTYRVEERMTVDVFAHQNGTELGHTWALNEAIVEKMNWARLLDIVLEVDGRPVSEFACDGVLCATPTGSTAYAFSAGGPVVWPEVQAMLLVPSNAHALFARPLVISPESRVALEVSDSGDAGVLVCDGRRTIELPPGSRVEVVRGRNPVLLARLRVQPFTDRLVRKFGLPVQGWRGRRR